MVNGPVVHGMDRTLGSRQLAALLSAVPHADGRPGYRALADGVRRLLLDGRIALHVRLPAERELASALTVSRATVTAAYDLLREDGFARSRRGAGTWTELPAGHRPANCGLLPGRRRGDRPGHRGARRARGGARRGLRGGGRPAGPAGLDTRLPPLRNPGVEGAVAERFARRGLPTLPDQILITNGAQQALSLTLGLLGRPGDRILVENPSYPNALDAMRRVGLRTTPVPVTAEGWAPGADRLRAAAGGAPARVSDPRLPQSDGSSDAARTAPGGNGVGARDRHLAGDRRDDDGHRAGCARGRAVRLARTPRNERTGRDGGVVEQDALGRPAPRLGAGGIRG